MYFEWKKMKASVLLIVMLAYCIFIMHACDAAEETKVPVPIIVPGDGENFPVAVYFADNMVFTPQ